MKKFLQSLLILSAALMLTGCSVCCGRKSDAAMIEAQLIIREGRASCVIISGNRLFLRNGRGIKPLLEALDREPELLRNAVVADKIIGKAAAMVLVSGGVRQVYGETMSADAKSLLEEHGISASGGTVVAAILNRERNGLCPLEDAVKDISAPDEAVAALRVRIAELMKKSAER